MLSTSHAMNTAGKKHQYKSIMFWNS